MAAPRGVRKVSENIVQDGRALLINEEDVSKYDWSEIPNGSLHVNPTTGLVSVKVIGESDWVPHNIKQDGTICIAKDSRIGIEIFTIKEINTNGFIYENEDGDLRNRNYTTDGYFNFEIEKGSYIKRRNHLDISIDDVLHRNASTGGLVEISEHIFALTDQLSVGSKITARYVKVFRYGNPYPRIFLDDAEPSPGDPEVGDFWLDLDEDFDSLMDRGLISY